MRLEGDFNRLELLIERFGRIASGDVVREMLKEIGDEVRDLVAEGFELSRDPYGQPWAPLKRRRDNMNRPLVKTGALRGSRRTYVVDSGIELRMSAPYASYHQDGTRFIPRRRMVPDGELPERWRAALEEIVDRKLHDLLDRV